MGGVAKAVGSVVGSLSGGVVSGLEGEAGLGNKFQSSLPPETLQRLQEQYGAMTPIQNNQQALAQALLAQSQGGGAVRDLTNQGLERAGKQGAGMLASAKGLSPAMAARMAAQQQAQGQQQALGMGAQATLASQGQLANLYNQQAQQNLVQQNLLYGAQGRADQVNAGISAQNAQQHAGMVGGILGGAGSLMNMMMTKGAAGGKSDGGFITAGEPTQDYSMVAAGGGYVPGKAKVAGDSPSNDTVHARLSPGEIVIPRSKAQDPEAAKAFIDHLMAKEGKKKKKGA